MIDNTKITNLFQANSLITNDDEFSRGKIIEGVRYGLNEYRRYIEKSIEVVQNQEAIKIPVRREVIYKEIENDTKNENEEKKAQEINEEKKVQEIRYYILTNNFNDRDVNKIEKELFKEGIKYVYSEQPNGNKNNNKSLEIRILDRKEEENYLILGTNDNIKYFYLKANDYQLQMQKKAANILINNPLREHTALQKLFDLSNKAKTYYEQNFEYLKTDPEWKILKDPQKFDGTYEQQEFVKKALQTKDFALLEGPPGSGKTTAIIELIIQLIKQDKRVLLVSATHVAVDNVIHRILTTYKKECEGLVVPIRISSDKGSIRKESVEPYRLQTFVKSTKKTISNNLRKRLNTKSKKVLYESLNNEKDYSFDSIILKSANLVGGTMIGILQHPDIKKGGIQEMFDVMIVDESSKVTFLDFLVPALYAKKWILVGDVNQLSPYTEEDFISENIDTTLKDEKIKENLVKSFEIKRKLISNNKWNEESLKIFFSKTHTKHDFQENLVYELNGNFNPTETNILMLNSADIVICEPTAQNRKIIANYVFVKSIIFEGHIEQTAFQNRQKSFHKNTSKYKKISSFYPFEFNSDRNQEWKDMVGSRLSQMYQYRFEPELKKEIKEEYDFLVPAYIHNDVENIRKIALPSILEMLQIGIGETKSKKGNVQNKLIYEGFKQYKIITDVKFQSLSYQHRMHDDIASISREYFYKGKNLKTANNVYERDDILSFYKPNEKKVIWVSNNDKTFRKRNRNKRQENINPTETKHIEQELQNFISEAKYNKQRNNEDFEIALLTFYREQEKKLRKMLQKLTNQKRNTKNFKIENVKITLSTVDKFQGDEADIVLLSFTKFTKKAFYNSPNRLNVALTRARFKLVLFGNRNWLAQNAQLKGLRKLAENFQERIKTN